MLNAAQGVKKAGVCIANTCMSQGLPVKKAEPWPQPEIIEWKHERPCSPIFISDFSGLHGKLKQPDVNTVGAVSELKYIPGS